MITELPAWVTQRAATGDNSVTAALIAGVNIAQRTRQLNQDERRLRMAENAEGLNQQIREAQYEDLTLRLEEGRLSLQDTRALRVAQTAYLTGRTDVEPPLATPRAMQQWRLWRADRENEGSEAVEWSSFVKDFSELDGRGKASVRAAGEFRKGALLPKHYEALSEAQDRMKDADLERQLTKAAELTELGIYRDSLKPTRVGQLIHDLPETDLAAMRAELRALDNMYEKGDIKGSKRGLFEGGGTIETAAQEYRRMQQDIFKKFDAKRIGTPRPAVQAAPAAEAIPTVTSKEDFDKLPSGTEFIGSDGKRYRKP